MKKFILALVFCVSTHIALPVQTQIGTNYNLGHGINVGVSTQQDISGNVMLGIFAAILMSKIAYDVSWQNSYFATVKELYSHLLSEVNHHNIDSMNHEAVSAIFDQMACDEILTHEAWLRGSYGSWLTPWNWMTSQKMAYQMVQVLAIVALHGPAFQVEEKLTGDDVVGIARGACSAVSIYPLMYYGQELDNHIAFIKESGNSIDNRQLRSLISGMLTKLGNIKYVLRQQKEYIDEVHTFETHKLLKEVRNASNNR